MAGAIVFQGGLPDWSRPESVQMIRLANIKPHPRLKQPRDEGDQEDIDELTENVRACGKIRTPLLVVKADDNPEEVWLVGGHCRFKAAENAGLTHAPCRLEEEIGSDLEVHRAMLLDNEFRKAVRPVDKAEALERHRLMLGENATAEDVAADLKMPLTRVEAALELLQLPDLVKPHVNSGAVKLGQARLVLKMPVDQRETFAAKLIAGTLKPQHLQGLVKGRPTTGRSRGGMRGLKTLQKWTVTTDSGKVIEITLQSAEATRAPEWLDALRKAERKIPVSMQLGTAAS